METKLARDEILCCFENGDINDGISKLRELANCSDKCYEKEIRLLKDKWKNFENGIYLKVFTQKQANELISCAASSLLGKIESSLQGSDEYLARMARNKKTLQKMRHEPLLNSEKHHIDIRNSVQYEKGAVFETSKIDSNERPIIISFIVTIGVLVSSYTIINSFFGGYENFGSISLNFIIVMNFFKLGLYWGLWHMKKLAAYTYGGLYILSMVLIFQNETIGYLDVIDTIFTILIIIYSKNMTN